MSITNEVQQNFVMAVFQSANVKLVSVRRATIDKPEEVRLLKEIFSNVNPSLLAFPLHHCWAVVAAACVCYINSLECGLVFDDIPAILENKDLRPSNPWTSVFSNDFWGTPIQKEESHKSYRPFCVLTFRINYLIHELQPWGYHLVNMILHVIVCQLYHRLCLAFLPSTPSVIAAILFAVHPIHTEAVTGVVGRAETLSSIFFLLAFKTYMNSINPEGTTDYLYLICCLGLVGMATLSKEQGITVVGICFMYDIFLVQRTPARSAPEKLPRGTIKGPTPTWRKDLVLRLLVLTSGTCILMVARLRLMGSTLPTFNKFDNPASAAESPTRQLTYNYLLPLNTWLLLFPSDLCCDWTMGTVSLVTSFFDKRNAATVAFYFAFGLLLRRLRISTRDHSRRIFIGVSLLVFPFVPASNLIFPVGFVIAERILYLPSMGFCLLVAYGWHLLWRKQKRKTVLLIALALILCLNTAKTIFRNLDWQSDTSLFLSGLRVTRRNAKLYSNLGHVMEEKGKLQDALDYFLEATKVQPDDIGAHLNVGRTYSNLGMLEEAEKTFWVAKNLMPQAKPGQPYRTHIVPAHLDIFLNLGNLLSRNMSRLEEAEELYRQAISMKADYIQAYLDRASVLMKLNRSQDAQDMYEQALKHDQMNPDIYYNLGVLLLEQGKSGKALVHFDQALQLDPEHEKSLMNYAILTQDTGDSNLRKLAHERLQVLLTKGRLPERIYFNMGMLAMEDEDLVHAESYFRKAIQFRQDFSSALFNLALLLHDTHRPLEAVPLLRRLLQNHKHHTKGLMLLGNIYFTDIKNFTAAKECYERVLKQEPVHIPALHNLCAAHVHLGHLQTAEMCLMKAAALAPNERYIDDHLKLVRQYQHQQRLGQQRQDQRMTPVHRYEQEENCPDQDGGENCSVRSDGKETLKHRDTETKNESDDYSDAANRSNTEVQL